MLPMPTGGHPTPRQLGCTGGRPPRRVRDVASLDDPEPPAKRSPRPRPSRAKARDTGADAVTAVRKGLSARLAEIIRSDPERAANAVEVGLIDRRWLEEPGKHPVSTATPREVLQRFLERSVEQKPSLVNQLGLNTLQLLAHEVDRDGTGATEVVTVVFTDLEGFTTYTAEQGDAAAIELLTEHHRRVGPVVRSRGGKIVKRLGDGLLLSFADPAAAALAGVEMVEVTEAPLRLRAGMHVGEAVVTATDVVGHVVNVAARVTEEADGGEVLVTAEVCEAAADVPGLEFGRSRKVRLKGLPGRTEVFSASAAPRPRARSRR
jgi:adenylate cyclase